MGHPSRVQVCTVCPRFCPRRRGEAALGRVRRARMAESGRGALKAHVMRRDREGPSVCARAGSAVALKGDSRPTKGQAPGYYRSGSNGQNVCSPRPLRPLKPKTCSLCSEDRLHTCTLSGERPAPTLRPRKQNYEALQLRASTRPLAACVNFKSLTPLTMTPKVSIV